MHYTHIVCCAKGQEEEEEEERGRSAGRGVPAPTQFNTNGVVAYT